MVDIIARPLFVVFNFFRNLINKRDEKLLPFFKRYWPNSKFLGANALCAYRLLISIYIACLLTNFSQTKFQILFWFIFGTSLDFFDGLIARAKNTASTLGAFLDRLADKTLVVPLTAYFFWPLSRWLSLTIIILEILSIIVALLGIGLRINISSNWIGKYKMTLQVVIAIMIFFIPLEIWQKYNLSVLVWIMIATAFSSFLGHLQSLYPKSN